MAYRVIVFLIVITLWATQVCQAECEVIEGPSGSEVICKGTPMTQEERDKRNKEEEIAAEVEKKEKEKKTAEANIEANKRLQQLDSTVSITDLDLRLLDKSYGYSTYSFKFTAANPGRAGKVWFKVTMYDRNNFMVDSFLLSSFFGYGESRTLTEKRMTKFSFDKWGVEATDKF